MAIVSQVTHIAKRARDCRIYNFRPGLSPFGTKPPFVTVTTIDPPLAGSWLALFEGAPRERKGVSPRSEEVKSTFSRPAASAVPLRAKLALGAVGLGGLANMILWGETP